MDNLNTVTVSKEDIGTFCDVAEMIHQHSTEGTKSLTIELPSDITLDKGLDRANMWSDDNKDITTWEQLLNWYASGMIDDFKDINFTIEQVENTIIITFV